MEPDITAADASPSTPSTDDSKSSGSGETQNSGQIWPLDSSDDSWIEDWDMTLHRCSHCDRPFVSAARLAQHVQTWHTGGAPVLRPYREPSSDTDAASHELVVIVPDGDLFLSVSKGPAQSGRRCVRFQVASPILWLASRVFNSMFGPNSRFQEAIALRRSNITGVLPLVVDLDDDPESLKFVLNALHFRSYPFPFPTYKLIVEVAAICDKYELHRALRFVAERHFLAIGQFEDYSVRSNWLLISYVFGFETLFEAVSKHIILHLTDAEQNDTIDWRTPSKVTGMARSVPSSVGIITDQVPSRNPEALAAKRNFITDRLETILRQVQENRSARSGESTPVPRCLQQAMQGECEALQFRHLEGNLEIGLLEDMRTKSLMKIYDEVTLLAPLPPRYSDMHRSCSWVFGFKFTATRLLSSVEGLRLRDIPSSVRF